jgi:Domain of unknown function (DUF2382)
MTDSPRLSRSDQPFPGAQSQVPGAHSGESDLLAAGEAGSTRLPLEVTAARSDQGWTIHLPVRAEHVTVSKRVFVRERVILHRNSVSDVQHVRTEIRREQLRVSTEGDPDVTRVGAVPTVAQETQPRIER